VLELPASYLLHRPLHETLQKHPHCRSCRSCHCCRCCQNCSLAFTDSNTGPPALNSAGCTAPLLLLLLWSFQSPTAMCFTTNLGAAALLCCSTFTATFMPLHRPLYTRPNEPATTAAAAGQLCVQKPFRVGKASEQHLPTISLHSQSTTYRSGHSGQTSTHLPLAAPPE
jgi:hypothetical protein